MNQEGVENHFSKLRAANGQNENPTYLLATSTQNSVIFGQSIINEKCDTRDAATFSFTELPIEKPCSKKK